MKKETHKHRLTLVLLIAVVIFVIQLVTVSIASAVVVILMRTGVIVDFSQSTATPGKTILLMSVITTVLGVMITIVTSRVYMNPVNRIISGMNRLASGDFKARLSFGKPISEHPAFIEISDSFNTMAQELESTEMLRSDFINNFSHEFKTPIVSIVGFAKLLKNGNLSQEQQREYLSVIERESVRLSAMATNVLNMTKVENQTILTDVDCFNLSEQIRSSVLLLEGKWSPKNISFDMDFNEYTIEASEELLKQVWINLIDNAIKFSPEGGLIEMAVTEAGDQLAVSVTNRGREITPEQQKKIWNKFYQADESHATEGNGIGLALVKRIVELHDGQITVESENQTTTFTVTLPKRR